MTTLIMSAGASLAQGASTLLSSNALRSAALTAGRTLAARAIANVLDDRKLEGPRLSELRLQTSTEGAQIPLVWGATRLSGQVIWAARFLERKTEREADGGKGGGPSVTEYDYSLSFAVGLCEGEIVGLGRVWANGAQINPSDYNYRLYRGGEDQEPDALIEAVQGAGMAPAYRGLAYIVFEDMPLTAFGDRIPQLAFEVVRHPKSFGGEAPLDQLVRAVDMIPTSGEFAYATEPVFRKYGPGALTPENCRNSQAQPDILVALDNLEAEAPNCDFVWLVTGWFGDDLRAGLCQIRPGVETDYKKTVPVSWSVAGVGRGGAHLVSQQDGAAIYGGTPSDRSVIQAIQALKARGFKVGLYPFILMDVPADNDKPDPYGGARQAAFPWRGRITCHPAAGQPGSPDSGTGAAAQIDSFFGSATAAHFSAAPGAVTYGGPDDWRADDLALTDSKAQLFERTRLDPNAAPVEARVRFYDPSRDYMLGAVSARRKDAAQEGVLSLDLPLSLDGAQAEAAAWRALAEARAARDQLDCALPARLLHLTPGDVVSLDLDGVSGAAFQIDSLVEGPVRRARLIRAPDAPNMASAGSAPGAGAPAPVFTPPEIALIDAPFAAGPQDWQILAAARAEPWPGALRVYAGASNEQLRLIGRVEAPAAMGELLEDLPAGRFAIWQEDARLHLSLRGAALQSATKRQVLNGANLLAVESPPESPNGGGWEFLQFRDADLVGAQEWVLSGLLRGQSGTDDQARTPIPAGARVVLIEDRIARLSLAESERGLMLQWRAGPAGRDRFGESYAALASAISGRALRPWGPCHLRAARQPGGDIRISWVRRARWGGDSWEGLDPPLSEEAEIYQVSIFASGILKRRLESAAPEATYALSAQIADYGAPASALELEVMQLSNRAGAGISRSGLIAVN